MASLNKVMLIGNLTRDPEVRFTPKGSAVSDLGIAVNRTYVTDSGEKMQETTYVDVVVWSRLAELAGQYLHKGSPVFIEGRLQMDTWEDKATGQKRSKIRVVADNLQFLGRREGGEDGGPPMGGGNGGGYQQSSPPQRSSNFSRPAGGPPQRQSPPPRQAQNDEFGDGPITDGLDDDEIPF
jgi:single-strand DNA-binding protein